MIKLIAAVSKNGCIGKDNDLIFQDKEDMKHFRETTTGHIVVMGKKTWESIPEAFRPFKGRENFVITKKTPIFDPALSGATILREINGKLWKMDFTKWGLGLLYGISGHQAGKIVEGTAWAHV